MAHNWQIVELPDTPDGERMYVSVRDDRRRIRVVSPHSGSFRVVDVRTQDGTHVVIEWTDESPWREDEL
jgi:hypothetical protein